MNLASGWPLLLPLNWHHLLYHGSPPLKLVLARACIELAADSMDYFTVTFIYIIAKQILLHNKPHV